MHSDTSNKYIHFLSPISKCFVVMHKEQITKIIGRIHFHKRTPHIFCTPKMCSCPKIPLIVKLHKVNISYTRLIFVELEAGLGVLVSVYLLYTVKPFAAHFDGISVGK